MTQFYFVPLNTKDNTSAEQVFEKYSSEHAQFNIQAINLKESMNL